MKRSMDLTRELLLMVEGNQQLDGSRWMEFEHSDHLGDYSSEEIAYHLTLLIEAGFIKGVLGMQMPTISRLTWEGHEFLDNIRDPGIWAKTKERVSGLTTVGLAIIGEIAKAEIKKKLGLS